MKTINKQTNQTPFSLCPKRSALKHNREQEAPGFRRTRAQRGQGMTEYIIVSESLYPCGFPGVGLSISLDCLKLIV